MSAVAFTSCDKKTNDPAPANNPVLNQGMTANVDGVNWVAALPIATNTDGDFTLAGISMSGQSIGFFALEANITKPGTYPVNAVYMTAPQDSSTGPTWVNPKATITIIKLDTTAKKVSGTFSFSATADQRTGASGVRNITNGVFTDITLQ